MDMSESLKNYLEAVFMLARSKGAVRSIDLARALNVSKPSVSYAVKELKQGGFIKVDGEGHIELLEPGSRIAMRMFERRLIISRMLMDLGVDEATALEDAKKMESALSDQTFACLKAHFAWSKKQPHRQER